MSDKNKNILIVILILIAFTGGYFTKPDKVVEVEKIKEVIKEVKVENKDIKKQVVIVEKPDGTKTTHITEEDKSQTNTNTLKLTEKENLKITENKAQAAIALGYGKDLRLDNYYSIEGRLRLFNSQYWAGVEAVSNLNNNNVFLIKLHKEF